MTETNILKALHDAEQTLFASALQSSIALGIEYGIHNNMEVWNRPWWKGGVNTLALYQAISKAVNHSVQLGIKDYIEDAKKRDAIMNQNQEPTDGC